MASGQPAPSPPLANACGGRRGQGATGKGAEAPTLFSSLSQARPTSHLSAQLPVPTLYLRSKQGLQVATESGSEADGAETRGGPRSPGCRSVF